MNSSTENALATKFQIYRRDDNYPSSFCYWGFECGDGWAPLLCEFSEEIDKLTLEGFRVIQIKEKFFRLIIHIECEGPDVIAAEELTELVERKSMSLCERCGESKSKPHKCHPRALSAELMESWASNIINNRNRLNDDVDC